MSDGESGSGDGPPPTRRASRDGPRAGEPTDPADPAATTGPASEERGSLERLTGGASVPRAVAVGLAAFLVGYVLTSGLLLADAAMQPDGGDGAVESDIQVDRQPGVVKTFGWMFFSTHFVELESDIDLARRRAFEVDVDLLNRYSEGLVVPSPLYRLVPVVVLLATGYLFASRTLPGTGGRFAGPKAGALLAVGYFLAVVAGTALFSHSTGFSAGQLSYRLPPGTALGLAGLVYPVAFGGLGGALAQRRHG